MLDKNAIVRIIAESESLGRSEMGTGFLFGEKYILTCNHVVDNNSQIKIQFMAIDGSNNKFLSVNKVIGLKENCLDYAILEISNESLSLKPLEASCLCLANTENKKLREGLFVQLAGHIETDDQRLSFYMTPEKEVTLGTPINNGFYLFQKAAAGQSIQDGFSGSPVLDVQANRVLGILNYTDANKYTDRKDGARGQMILSGAIKKSLQEYDADEKNKIKFCDLLFTREEPLDTSYIKDNYTKNIQILAQGLGSAILFIGPGINLYDRNYNLEEEELKRICDFNNNSSRSLSEIEFAYFLEEQIRKRKPEIKCLQAEISRLKIQPRTDQDIPCPSCPHELSKRPENCLFRLENDSQAQTNNQPSIEEQLMNAQVGVQFLSQYYSDLCEGTDIREDIQKFYAQSQPNDAHKLIAKYVKNGKIKLIITTNCDNLLECAFDDNSLPKIEDYGVYGLTDRLIENEPLICLRKNESPDAPIILKLHGCYKSMSQHNLLITKSHFSKYYSVSLYHHFEKFMKQLLNLSRVNLNWRSNIWFVGYTLHDPDINLVINIFKSGLEEKSKSNFYWVYCPILSLNKTNRLWHEDKHLKLVPRTLESFFNDLEHFYGLLN